MSSKPNEASVLTIGDPAKLKGELKVIGGSRSDEWNHLVANQTVNALWLKHSNPAERDRQYSAAVAAMMGIAPLDEIEGMVAAQLIAAHAAAMECYRRAMIADQTFEGRRENLSQANKLTRSFAGLVDALNRHRGKGQQKVTVEHVHVHAGGQAVVGNVTPGGGGARKAEEQPHALGYAPGTAMRGADTDGDPLPIASDAERALPDARRDEPGRS